MSSDNSSLKSKFKMWILFIDKPKKKNWYETMYILILIINLHIKIRLEEKKKYGLKQTFHKFIKSLRSIGLITIHYLIFKSLLNI